MKKTLKILWRNIKNPDVDGITFVQLKQYNKFRTRF